MPSDELLIVDSGSNDETLQIARQHGARILHLDGPFGYGKALNAGFAAARNPWVLVLSSHCIPLVSPFLAVFRTQIPNFPGSLALASGSCQLIDSALHSDPVADRHLEFVDLASWKLKLPSLAGNRNTLYRRAHWQDHPFDEQLVTAEDVEWCLWAINHGRVLTVIPGAAVLYRNQGSLRHMFAKGRDEARAGRRFLSSPPLPIKGLFIGFASRAKMCLSGGVPPGTAMREVAHLLGSFMGSRRKTR